MTIEIKVPDLPESVADATIATWHKKPGDLVARDEVLVDIETDKVVLEVPAPEAGVLGDILQSEGATVLSRQLIAMLKPAPVAGEATSEKPVEAVADDAADGLSPSVRRMVAEHDIDVAKLTGTGVTKEDVEAFIKNLGKAPVAAPTAAAPMAAAPVAPLAGRTEKRVPMTRLRKRIAERLLEAKNTTAMLTTFNEINMKPVMDLRARYKDQFEKKHGVRLGFMGFFVKAVVEGLKRFPAVNGSIDGNDIVYHGYYDIGVAVSSPRGLVVPILRNADQMSLADIEKAIGEFGKKAKDGTLTVEEMTGGTFTITNGGVFGSLMSTPILNPPQSGILGMHATKDRPVAENGQVVIRPMMYVAHSYDHRIIDGREAVTFLVTIKECIEDPARILLNV
jgi:2-oxoglutarate dehydrogenase E2 component (dihydrolipoamide succinyltransferase)